MKIKVSNDTYSSLYVVWYKPINKQLYFINFELRKTYYITSLLDVLKAAV
jgi:hypothetical protein